MACLWGTTPFFETQRDNCADVDMAWFNDGCSTNMYDFAMSLHQRGQINGESVSMTRQFRTGTVGLFFYIKQREVRGRNF